MSGRNRNVGLSAGAILAVLTVVMLLPLPMGARSSNHLATEIGMKGGGLNELGRASAYRPTHEAVTTAGTQVSGMLASNSSAPSSLVRASTFAPALAGPVTSPQLLSSFEGATQLTSGGYLPPDTQIAASGIYVLELTNEFGRVTSMNGSTVYSHFTTQSFFSTNATDSVGDVQALFDPITVHWFVTALDFTTNQVHIGVSKTSSPIGAWWHYFYYTNFAGFPSQSMDQPVVGNSQTMFPVSTNQFNKTSGAFLGSILWVANKHKLEIGTLSYGSISFFGVQSVHPSRDVTTNGSGTDVLYAATTGTPSSSTTLTEYSIVGPSPAFTVTIFTYTIANTGVVPPAVQPGTTTNITTGDDRVQSVSWSGVGALWVAFTTACTPSGPITLSCVRVDGISTGANSMFQDTDTAVAGMNLFYGSLVALPTGSAGFLMVLGFSGSLAYPGIAMTGQNGSDPAGTYRGPIPAFVGPSYDTTLHFGDYSGIQLMPGGTKPTAWAAGEYDTVSAGWATQVIHFAFY
jgi:hypothetical protein